MNRDTLFSYHKVSEAFLQRMMALYVSSHYKNSPNDLILMSDAPAHHLFVLLPRLDENTHELPDILCVIQVALEGEISKESVAEATSRAKRPSGDLIPWNISQQFQDDDFPQLSGARVVRIATHPDFQKMGYGSRALEQLQAYYEGKMADLDGPQDAPAQQPNEPEVDLHVATLKPKKNLPPLLAKLSERTPERLHYLGVSFGLTPALFSFWKCSGFLPVYLRLTELSSTGEHTAIMLRTLNSIFTAQDAYSDKWLLDFYDGSPSLSSFSSLTFSFRLLQTLRPSLRLRVPQVRREDGPFHPVQGPHAR